MNKSEIIGQDCGRHNGSLEQSTFRISKGASWKKARTILIIPSADMIHAKVALSLSCLIAAPNQPFYKMLALGDEVGVAYSKSIESILSHPDLSTWEYVASFEHDMIVPPDGLIKLIDRMEQHPEFAAISGLYWTKLEGGVPQCWGNPHDAPMNFRPQPPPPVGEIREYTGLGMGFCVFRLNMFKDPNLPRPWFITKKGQGGCCTQDLGFWTEARKFGYRGAVDAGVLCGHLDVSSGIVW